jgi:phosphate transport system substrate-binding protein
VLTDQPGDGSWPITGASFVLIHREQHDAARAKSLLDFFAWCFAEGDAAASNLDYVPMPDDVVTLVESLWRTDVKSAGVAVWK